MHCQQSGILISHFNKNDAADSRSTTIVVLVGFQNKLLIHVVLNQLIGAGGYGVQGEVLPIRSLGNDTHIGDCQNERGIRLAKPDHDIAIVDADAFHARKIQACRIAHSGFIAENHIFRSDGASVREPGPIPQLEAISKGVLTNGIIRCQIGDDPHLCVGLQQGRIHDLDAGGKSVQGIIVGGDAGKTDDDLIFLRGFCSRLRILRTARLLCGCR